MPRVKAKGLRTRLTQKGWDQTHTLWHVTVQQNASASKTSSSNDGTSVTLLKNGNFRIGVIDGTN